MAPRTRYALVGTGSRAQMYLDAIAGPHADVAELVAWADTNPGRLDWYDARLRAAGIPSPARFAPGGLAPRCASIEVDRVIVTSPDWTHADHVVAALEAGADVIVEKPLTTTDLRRDDPGVGVEWPVPDPLLSDRDIRAPRLAAVADELPFTY